MSDTLTAVDLDDALAQYGVLGMKWGVSKVDRAPKKTEAEKAAAVKAKRKGKAQKYVDRAAAAKRIIDEATAERDKKSTGAFKRYRLDNTIQDQREIRTRALDDARRKREGKLSLGEKKLLIGGSIVAGLLAAKGISVGLESGEFSRLAKKGTAFMQKRDATAFAKNLALADKSLSPDQILDKVVAPINRNYGLPGTRQNCRRATFAYELRRRGNDVKASKTTNAFGQHAGGLWNALHPGEKRKRTSKPGLIMEIMREQMDEDTRKAQPINDLIKRFPAGAKNSIWGLDEGKSAREVITKHLSNEPNGSRGELGVMWKGGGGHSVAYEIIDNVAVIFDAQSGRRLDTGATGFGADMLDNAVKAGFTRLDNAELNADYLLRWVNNVTK